MDDYKKNLLIEKRNLQKAIKQMQEDADHAFIQYLRMEGMYGRKVDDNFVAMHERGYHYEYDTLADKMREQTEREAFAQAHNDFYADCSKEQKRIDEIDNELCLIDHGMSIEEYNLRQEIEATQRRIDELKENLQAELEVLTDYQNKLKIYLAFRVDV